MKPHAYRQDQTDFARSALCSQSRQPELAQGPAPCAAAGKADPQWGRNNTGRITTRHQGGGHKQHYRLVDFKRDKDNIPARVERLEYDPNRSAHIALLLYADGERRYIIAPREVGVGVTLMSGPAALIAGQCPTVTGIFRSVVRCIAWSCDLERARNWLAAPAQRCNWLLAKAIYATLRLRSGEILQGPCGLQGHRRRVGNEEHNLRSRWARPAPSVGWVFDPPCVAMNPVDHPHGGGEGRTSGGRHPVSPWGIPTKGYKTRSNKRTDKLYRAPAKGEIMQGLSGPESGWLPRRIGACNQEDK